MLLTQRVYSSAKRPADTSMADFAPIKLLSRGPSGNAFLVKHRRDGSVYVMKQVEKKNIQENNLRLDTGGKENREVKLQQGSPFLAEIHHIFYNKLRVYLLFEF